jgi:hypothetical protein
MGGQDVDLGAVALRATEAETHSKPRGGPETPTAQQPRLPLRSTAPELISDDEEDSGVA